MNIEITFDELIEHGKKYCSHAVDGVPWSFNFMGCPVTHENNDTYIINTKTKSYVVKRDNVFYFDGEELKYLTI